MEEQQERRRQREGQESKTKSFSHVRRKIIALNIDRYNETWFNVSSACVEAGRRHGAWYEVVGRMKTDSELWLQDPERFSQGPKLIRWWRSRR